MSHFNNITTSIILLLISTSLFSFLVSLFQEAFFLMFIELNLGKMDLARCPSYFIDYKDVPIVSSNCWPVFDGDASPTLPMLPGLWDFIRNVPFCLLFAPGTWEFCWVCSLQKWDDPGTWGYFGMHLDGSCYIRVSDYLRFGTRYIMTQ